LEQFLINKCGYSKSLKCVIISEASARERVPVKGSVYVALGTPRLDLVLGPASVPSEEVTSIMSMLLLLFSCKDVMEEERRSSYPLEPCDGTYGDRLHSPMSLGRVQRKGRRRKNWSAMSIKAWQTTG
jgi:hypothetical protein